MPRNDTVETMISAAGQRATNITLPEPLLQEARALAMNVSKACEVGLVAAVVEQRPARWLVENKEASAAWNAHVEKHGLPLDAYRQF